MTRGTPPWPSLYSPGLEILNIEHRPPTQPGGAYLESPAAIFRFTFYWTLILYTPFFLFCGAYAFWNYTFPPNSSHPTARPHQNDPSYELVSTVHTSPLTSRSLGPGAIPSKLPKINERRSRATFATIVFFSFVILSVAGSVVGSAILGFVTFGLFKSAGFHMSTWVPFLLAVLQVLIGLLSVWPSIIEII